MGKLKKLFQVEVIRILGGNGFVKTHSAKHITFKKYLPNGQVLTTWIPHHRQVTIFVLQYIIKQSGKSRKEFES